jgi:hypothetical protein
VKESLKKRDKNKEGMLEERDMKDVMSSFGVEMQSFERFRSE